MVLHDYIIADFRLRSEIDIVEIGLRSFRKFEVESTSDAADAYIRFDKSLSTNSFSHIDIQTSAELELAEADGTFSKTECGHLFHVVRRSPHVELLFHIEDTTNVITTNFEPSDEVNIAIMRYALWVMFGIVLLKNNAVAIHSSAIVVDNMCALFLGESGTGKSTHTRLWRENIAGASLLNDDSPIIRIIGNKAMAYGSPWSGKTPCYKTECYPIGMICRLSQAPHNKMRQLRSINAIGALLPSCPPILAHDEYLQDCICNVVGEIITRTRIFHLECLPNAEAAEMSHLNMTRHA